MDMVDASLFSKTFAILGTQLFLTFLSTHGLLRYIRGLHAAGHPSLSATKNADGELDLHLDFKAIQTYFYGLLIADIVVFLLLLFLGKNDLSIGLPLFTLWSVLTGLELALVLISVDENLGAKVLGVTASIVSIAAWAGIYSGIDFSFLGKFLFIALLGLMVFNLGRIFISIRRGAQRVAAAFGVLIFTGYLLFDFNRLQKLDKAGVNTWPMAMDLSISLYLDIINLFLELLDLLSD